MIEMAVESIRVSLTNYQRVVILKEKEAERYLPIWIGPAEADAIAVQLQDIPVPRPLTHDLLRSVISALGATVNFIVVNDLANDTFYARLHMDVDSRHLELDCRPSDAIALAVRVKVPIYAEESVLEKAGIVLEQGQAKPASPDKVDEAELRRLSAFREFIDTLDLSDLEPKRDKPEGDKPEGS